MAPPRKTSAATCSRTIIPTPSRATDRSLPRYTTLLPTVQAPSSVPLNRPAKPASPLNTSPNRTPSATRHAARPSPPVRVPERRTAAQATPSGNGRSAAARATNTRRMGIISTTPSSPPARATRVVSSGSNRCQAPTKTSAGMVKMMPAASDSPAEAAVCAWLASSSRPGPCRRRSSNMDSTAAGMEADTVMPTLRPR